MTVLTLSTGTVALHVGLRHGSNANGQRVSFQTHRCILSLVDVG